MSVSVGNSISSWTRACSVCHSSASQPSPDEESNGTKRPNVAWKLALSELNRLWSLPLWRKHALLYELDLHGGVRSRQCEPLVPCFITDSQVYLNSGVVMQNCHVRDVSSCLWSFGQSEMNKLSQTFMQTSVCELYLSQYELETQRWYQTAFSFSPQRWRSSRTVCLILDGK